MGFFERFLAPKEEQTFVLACREQALGEQDAAFALFEQTLDLADGAFMAGVMALDRGQLDKAARYFESAVKGQERLGTYFSKYSVSAVVSLPITDQIVVHLGPNLAGALFSLVEVYQRQKKFEAAMACLQRLQQIDPGDQVVRLSLVEVLLDFYPDDKEVCQKVVQLASDIENTSPVAAALMLYKARALRGLGMAEAAKNLLTAALRSRKDRPDDLLHALRYERALAYEDLKQKGRAHTEFEKLWAEDASYADVAQRLGM